MTSPHIGIIGGGIAGSTAALHFSQLGYQVTIFERGASLVDGPPICHLHAGGNLYREISQDQCVQLLKESIETVKLYQHTLNVRPTVIAVPTQDKGQPEELLPRLQVIRQTYQDLVDEDASNQVLGEPSHYFKLYSKAELEALALLNEPDPSSLTEKSLDEWMIPFARNVDLNTLKFPVVLVQEYGLSVFRLSASVKLALAQGTHCQVHTQTQVVGVSKREASSTQTAGWVIQHQPYRVAQSQDSSQPINTAQASTVQTTAVQTTTVDYLINASGYQTGVVDDWIEAPRSRLVEFKAAYVTHWQQGSALWPEVIFHGERGTPQGMAQLTPYPDGYFQLHGMTEDITLFEDGVATSTEQSSQPKLPEHLVNKIIHGWSEEQQNDRTNKAIKHMAQFIPSFASATIGGKPLFGAQQIPGSDITLRAASVSFAGDNYARMEIVKASSALEAAKQIEQHIRGLGWQILGWQIEQQTGVSNTLEQLDSEQVLHVACELAEQRQYPVALAKVGGIKLAVK